MPELVNDDDNINHHDQDMNYLDKPPSPNPDISFSDPDVHPSNHGVHPPQPSQPEPFSSNVPKILPGMICVLHLTINGMLQFVLYISHLPIL